MQFIFLVIIYSVEFSLSIFLFDVFEKIKLKQINIGIANQAEKARFIPFCPPLA
jgi:hypothetical protein